MKEIAFVDNIHEFLSTLQYPQMLLLVDENVHKNYSQLLDEFDTIVVPPGEYSKSFTLVEELIGMMLESGYQRDSLLVGVGGGVVTDITGFVASVYMRGMPFGLIPTTLLAMTDAAIGGKNGVNVGKIKNCAGTIRQPEFVTVWPDFLNTLAQKEFRNGMAEVIKHAILEGDDFMKFLFENIEKIKQKDDQILKEMIQRSADFKLSIVKQDEFDNDVRHLLNLGHTIAHALEAETRLSHGECVAAGIILDAKIAQRKELCDDNFTGMISQLMKSYELPETIPYNTEALMSKIAADKKRRENHIRYVLPVAPGDYRIVNMDESELRNHLKNFEND